MVMTIKLNHLSIVFSCWVKILNWLHLLRNEFFVEDSGQYAVLSEAVKAELSFGSPMSEEMVQLRITSNYGGITGGIR